MTDKKRALETARKTLIDVRAGPDVWELQLNTIAAALLRAQAEALEGVYQLIGAHSGLDNRIIALRAAADELEASNDQ